MKFKLAADTRRAHTKILQCSAETALLVAFEMAKIKSKVVASPYAYVVDWFRAQFPNYKDAVVFNDGKLTVAPVKKPDIIQYKQKLPKVG